MQFNIGDKVVQKALLKARTSFSIFIVQGYLNGGVLTVAWGSGYDGEIDKHDLEVYTKPGKGGWHSSITRFKEEELLSVEEALEEIKKLDAVEDKLNEEFETVRFFIQKKLDKATSLIKEAHAMAKPFDKDFCDLKRECKGLYQALDSGGWSHSSMKC